MIQEDRENRGSINPIVDGKNNKLIQSWFDDDEGENIETLKMDTWADFIDTSLAYRSFSILLTTSFYVDGNPNGFEFSSGFKLLKKDLYLKTKGFLESNKMAIDIFTNVAREHFKHELIHVLELHSSWRTVSHKEHGMQNYMSSRTERRTWGQDVVDEVNFMLQTFKEAERLFPEETTDFFNSPYRVLKFSFEQGTLREYIKLTSVQQLIGNKDLISKTLEWINLPQNEEKFSDVDVQDDFILKTFPILKQKTFRHWMKMVEKSIKDNSSGSVSFIGGKGDNPERYKKCLKRFFDICSKKGMFKPIIYVFTGASKQKNAGEYEVKLLREMGADVKVFKSFTYLPIEIPSNLNGIFFTGGDQSRLMKELGLSGKTFIQKANAGAAALSEKIIVGGDDEPVLADGIGLITKYIVDQHFSSRSRKTRLQKAMELTGLRGISIDEDTMITVFDDGYSEVTGAANVIIIFNEDEFELIMEDGQATSSGLIF
jgi:cyanophycinase